jgi:hypothetical protein
MGVEIIFVPSAFKHGISEEDIRCAHKTMTYTGLTDKGYDALDEEMTRSVPTF